MKTNNENKKLLKKRNVKDEETTKQISDNEVDKTVTPKYGPLISFPNQRIWSRAVLVLSTLFIIYITSKSHKEISFAKQRDLIQGREQNVVCSTDYKEELDRFPGCVPKECGRYVTDKLITRGEADKLLEIGMKGFSLGVSDGGASILDLHSGALSMGQKFVNIYKLDQASNLFTVKDFSVYKVVRTKIQNLVSHHFGISADSLYLTHPTFFSRITSEKAVTVHDEYWHPHVDKETYKSFHYTSLLYLNDFGIDFDGGRFVFLDKKNSTVVIEPRKGRVSTFTSGSENIHYVEKVKSGTRFALTVSFTCDKSQSIADPTVSS